MKLRILTAALSLAALMPAQEPEQIPVPSLRSPVVYFKHHLEPRVEAMELKPPAKLEDYVVNGKLELSLKAYLDLVLNNNTDLLVNRITIQTTRNAITSAFSRFDPTLTMSFNNTRQTQLNTDARVGDAVTKSLSQPYSLSYRQTLTNGTTFTGSYNGSRATTSSSTSRFNPSFSSTMQFNVTQPLLRDRGGAITKLAISQARTRYRQSEFTLETQVISAVQQAELAYWSLIESRENLKVQEKGLENQIFQLSRNEKELELGAISPLEIYQPKQSKAQAEVNVTRARYTLQQSEDALRRQIGADLDVRFRDIPIELTEDASVPDDNKPLDKEMYVSTAMQKLASLKSTRMNLDLDDMSLMTAKNGLLPNLSLTGNYSNNGRGGNTFDSGGSLISPGGFSDSFSQMLSLNSPTYAFGLNLTLPIRDRAAAVNMSNALITKRANMLRLRSAEQSARLNVLNAVTNVESARASLKLSQVAAEFSQLNLDAENKRYELGVSTIFLVTNATQSLTSAQSSLVTSAISLRRNLINLLVQTGTLLEERGIVVEPAK